MRKKLLFTLSFILIGLFVFAKPVTLDYAKNVATKWYKHYSSYRTSDFTISNTYVSTYEGTTTFYTISFTDGGFVLVSADDATLPILGYSSDGSIDMANLPANVAYWLNGYSKQIKNIVDANLSNSSTIQNWDNILRENFERSTQSIAPICSTKWDQSAPYNLQCPSGTYTGCVATAMAQIMKKWNYPITGNGSHSYTHATYGVLSADFGSTTYDWANMLNVYPWSGGTQVSKDAVAKIMSHCGIGVDMGYGTSGSGAFSWTVPGTLINYFRYQPTAEIKYLADFSTANWITMIKAELDANRPCYYSGTDGSAGHAFVCDGYNSSNQFHFNWGWSGMSDGYFAIGALNPSGSTFNLDNGVIVRIRPLDAAVPIANFSVSSVIPAVGANVDFTNTSTGNPTAWSWVFDGGTPATSNLQTPPSVTFATAGNHLVSLTVSNASGTDTKTSESLINVGGAPSVWTKQNTGFTTASRGIDQIFIVDPQVVWAKAYDGANPTGYIREFTKTTNGGTTWTPGSISFTNSTTYGVANLFAHSDAIAYAAMFPTGANGGAIAKTTDGGLTWNITGSPDYSTSWLNWVHFFNANDGVCMGDPSATGYVIYTTNNGGTSWTRVPAANIPVNTSNETGIVNFYDAVDNTIWFGTSLGRVYKSLDKGIHWTVTETGVGAGQANVSFKDQNVGFVILSIAPYTVKKTTDGGATWSAYAPTGFFVKSPTMAYLPGTTSMWVDVASGPNKGSSYSLDDGNTWLNIDTGSVQYTDLAFFDLKTGWAGSFNTSATDGGIYKWELMRFDVSPMGPYCVNDSMNITLTVNGAMNAGNTFTAQLSDANGFFTQPIVVGTLTSNVSGTISCIIPANTPPGNNYKIRVISSNPATETVGLLENIVIHSLAPVSAGIDASICQNSSYQLNGSALNQTSLTWSTSGTGTFDNTHSLTAIYTPSTADNTAGSVDLTITATSYCGESNDVIHITFTGNANANAGADASICNGSNILLVANGGTSYTWANNPGLSSTSISNPVASPTTTTTYAVTVTSSCGTASDDIVVTVKALPTVSIAAFGDTTFCLGQSVELRATSDIGNTYQWMNNGLAITNAIAYNYTATGSGSYTVMATNAFSCNSVSNAAHVIAMQLPSADVLPTGNVTSCVGDSIILTAPSDSTYSYQWKKDGINILGASLPTCVASATGIYMVQITNSNGCVAISANTNTTFNPAPPKPTITAISNGRIRSNSTTLNQWFLNGVAIPGATAQIYTPTQEGIYTVQVSNTFGCGTKSDPFNFSYPVGISEATTGVFSVYPNPGSTTMYVEYYTETEHANISILNVLGETLYSNSSNASIGMNTLTIDVSNISEGIYFVKLQTNRKPSLKRIIVNH